MNAWTDRRTSRRDIIKGGLAAVFALPFLDDLARAEQSALTFVALGDWGRDGAHNQREVGVQMGKTAADISSRFVMTLGDNFYDDGVSSVTDSQWRSSYEDIYTAPSLQTPWYPVLGNHDYHGNVQAQIDYSKTSHRWSLPERYYKRSETLPTGGTVDFFILDTSPMVEKYRGSNTKIDDQDHKTQLAWLDSALAQSKAEWKIASGHHPVFSGGKDHGNTPEMIRYVKPLFDKYGVNVYFSGHDHDQQHIVVDGVNYIPSGAGSQTRETSLIAGSKFASDRSGFCAAMIAADQFHFAFIDYTGQTLYQADFPRKG